jgi:hypothetical protein
VGIWSRLQTMRQYIRHPSEMPIQYQPHDTGMHAATRDNMQNVSSGGLAFHSEEQLEPGSLVDIRIDVRPPPFTAEGRVVWCHQKEDGYLIGLQFDDTDIEYSLRMVEQVCYIEQYRREILRKEGRRISSEQAASEWISRYAADFPV